MTIRGILFDLDGTLADTLPICIQAYKHSFEQLSGRPYTDEEVTRYFGATEEGIFQKVLPDQWREGLQLYYDTYAQLQAACPEPFPGIKRVLNLLKERDVSMAIVTGRGTFNTHRTLDYLNIAHFFTIVEGGDVDKVVKMHAMQRILATWGIPPREAAYVGDTETDMQEAQAAGVLPLAALWADTATIHLPPADGILALESTDAFIAWIISNIPIKGGEQ